MWCQPTSVSQQAISQRFLNFPSELFEKVFKSLLPSLRTDWFRITRLKKGASIKVEQVFTDSYALRDRLIRLGAGTRKTPQAVD